MQYNTFIAFSKELINLNHKKEMKEDELVAFGRCYGIKIHVPHQANLHEIK